MSSEVRVGFRLFGAFFVIIGMIAIGFGVDRDLVLLLVIAAQMALFLEFHFNVLGDLFSHIDPNEAKRGKSAYYARKHGIGAQGSMMRQQNQPKPDEE